MSDQWVPYEGPRGGTGWKNNQTDEVAYQDEIPGDGRSSPSAPDSPRASPAVRLTRFTVGDGTRGLMNNQVLDRSKLTDDEESELIEAMDFGLQQPRDVPAGSVFYFTDDGLKKHARLIELLKKASKGLVNEEVSIGSDFVWETDDGQVAADPGNVVSGPVASWAAKKFKNPDHARAFLEWFGDSKAVDENGEPLRVLHGSRADISIFDKGKSGGSVQSKALGIPMMFFTNSETLADAYAATVASVSGGTGANVTPVYMSFKNPLVIEGNGREWTETGSEIIDKIDVYRFPLEKEFKEFRMELNNKYPFGDEFPGEPGVSPTDAEVKKFRDMASAVDDAVRKNPKLRSGPPLGVVGYDGIIIRNVVDRPALEHQETESFNPASDVYVAFESSSVKSATGNRGTFDPDNPNIRMSWTPYEGPRGGTGWQNSETGEVAYQDDKPGDGGRFSPDPSGEMIPLPELTEKRMEPSGWMETIDNDGTDVEVYSNPSRRDLLKMTSEHRKQGQQRRVRGFIDDNDAYMFDAWNSTHHEAKSGSERHSPLKSKYALGFEAEIGSDGKITDVWFSDNSISRTGSPFRVKSIYELQEMFVNNPGIRPLLAETDSDGEKWEALLPVNNIELEFSSRPKVTSWAIKRFKNPHHARAFLKWFGDSKLVGDDGEPIAAYHGTSQSFSSFDPNKRGSENDPGYLGAGFYFANAEWASGYAEVAAEDEGAANVMPVFLKMENPLVLDSIPVIPTIDRKSPVHGVNQIPTKREAEAFTKSLQAQGYDGIILAAEPGGTPEYVVFDPSNIKSATGNEGTFDPDNPNIRMSWTPYEGPRGGRGWQDSENPDDIRYQDDKPDDSDGGAQSSDYASKLEAQADVLRKEIKSLDYKGLYEDRDRLYQEHGGTWEKVKQSPEFMKVHNIMNRLSDAREEFSDIESTLRILNNNSGSIAKIDVEIDEGIDIHPDVVRAVVNGLVARPWGDESPWISNRYVFRLKGLRSHWREDTFEFEIHPRHEVTDVPEATLEDVPHREGYVYRGMSREEWNHSVERGYIESLGSHNLDQEGLTFYGGADTAQYYSTGFAPFAYRSTPGVPGVVIEVPRDQVMDSEDMPGKIPGSEFAHQGQLPIDKLTNRYNIHVKSFERGKVEAVADNSTGKVKEGSRMSPGGSYAVEKVSEDQVHRLAIQPGTRKTEKGVEYVLRDSRWHRADEGKSGSGAGGKESKAETIAGMEKRLEMKYADHLDILNLSERNNSITLNDVRMKPGKRGGGVGSKIIKELQEYAASKDKPIVLTAESEPRKKTALEAFYRRHGFRKPGSKRDYSLPRHTHVWRPRFGVTKFADFDEPKHARVASGKPLNKKQAKQLAAEIGTGTGGIGRMAMENPALREMSQQGVRKRMGSDEFPLFRTLQIEPGGKIRREGVTSTTTNVKSAINIGSNQPGMVFHQGETKMFDTVLVRYDGHIDNVIADVPTLAGAIPTAMDSQNVTDSRGNKFPIRDAKKTAKREQEVVADLTGKRAQSTLRLDTSEKRAALEIISSGVFTTPENLIVQLRKGGDYIGVDDDFNFDPDVALKEATDLAYRITSFLGSSLAPRGDDPHILMALQPGTRKTEKGVEYVLKDSRWHRADEGKSGSGAGGKESKADKPKAAFISTPVIPSVGNDSPSPIVFGPDNNVVRGSIGDFPITSVESGVVEKTSKKTVAMLEDAFSDPDIQKTLRQAGINGVRFDKKRGPGKPKEWSGGMFGGMLIFHPRTAESIAKSKVAVRREHGIKRIINHEAGHAMWKNVNPELKSEFANEIAKHPEIVDTVRGIVNIKPPSDAFDPDAEKRAISEVHAELNAMRLYDEPAYSKLPEGVRATASKITDAADVLADRMEKRGTILEPTQFAAADPRISMALQPGTRKTENGVEYVLKDHRWHRADEEGATIPDSDCGPAGECFANARRYAIHHDDSKVVHGKVTNLEGNEFDHAWVEVDGYVVDPTQGVKIEKGRWYDLTSATAESEYTAKEAAILSVQTGKHGPWTKSEQSRVLGSSVDDSTKSKTRFTAPDTKEFKGFFLESTIVDAGGKPRAIFHATSKKEKFDYFMPWSHFGTLKQASDRFEQSATVTGDDMDIDNKRVQGGRIFPVYARIENPVRLPDMGKWENAEWVTRELLRLHGGMAGEHSGAEYAEFYMDEENAAYMRPTAEPLEQESDFELSSTSTEELKDIFMAFVSSDGNDYDVNYNSHSSEDNANAFEQIAEILKSEGYDGIEYKNVAEGEGNDSYIIFDSDQVKSAIGNKGAYDPKDKRLIMSLSNDILMALRNEDDKKGAPLIDESEVPLDEEFFEELERFIRKDIGEDGDGEVARMAIEWVPYQGARGGTGWQDPSNPSDIRYQAEKPSRHDTEKQDNTAESVTLYRGTSTAIPKLGHYYSTNMDWSRQFTQSGQDSEINSVQVSLSDILVESSLPSSNNVAEIDAAIAKAREGGYRGFLVDEGPREANSVFFVDKVHGGSLSSPRVLEQSRDGKKKSQWQDWTGNGEEVTWLKSIAGGWTSAFFKTPKGREFRVRVEPGSFEYLIDKMGLEPLVGVEGRFPDDLEVNEFEFFDDGGSQSVTNRGEAMFVMRQVARHLMDYAKHDPSHIMSFSSYDTSRSKLYSFLVKKFTPKGYVGVKFPLSRFAGSANFAIIKESVFEVIASELEDAKARRAEQLEEFSGLANDMGVDVDYSELSPDDVVPPLPHVEILSTGTIALALQPGSKKIKQGPLVDENEVPLDEEFFEELDRLIRKDIGEDVDEGAAVARMSTDWQPYEGPKGGTGWQDPSNPSDIRYQAEKPSRHDTEKTGKKKSQWQDWTEKGEEVTWDTNEYGYVESGPSTYSESYFKTPEGRNYEVKVYPVSPRALAEKLGIDDELTATDLFDEIRAHSFEFLDDQGDQHVTNRGEAMFVMRQVARHLMDYAKHDPSAGVISFTAAERSRSKLYSFLVKKFTPKGYVGVRLFQPKGVYSRGGVPGYARHARFAIIKEDAFEVIDAELRSVAEHGKRVDRRSNYEILSTGTASLALQPGSKKIKNGAPLVDESEVPLDEEFFEELDRLIRKDIGKDVDAAVSRMAIEWQAFKGPRGGAGWQDPSNPSDIRYQVEKPSQYDREKKKQGRFKDFPKKKKKPLWHDWNEPKHGVEWKPDRFGNLDSKFTTPGGRTFTTSAVPLDEDTIDGFKDLPGLPSIDGLDFVFSEDKHERSGYDYSINNRGEAMFVMRQAARHLMDYARENSPQIITFTSSEKSRSKLYRFLVKKFTPKGYVGIRLYYGTGSYAAGTGREATFAIVEKHLLHDLKERIDDLRDERLEHGLDDDNEEYSDDGIRFPVIPEYDVISTGTASLALQPGIRKIKQGREYVLNENHRWESVGEGKISSGRQQGSTIYNNPKANAKVEETNLEANTYAKLVMLADKPTDEVTVSERAVLNTLPEGSPVEVIAEALGYEMDDPEVAEEKVEDKIQKLFRSAKVAVRVPGDALASILKDGRLKTQFETKKSRGDYDPAARAKVEKSIFGIHEDTQRGRPIYGYIYDDLHHDKYNRTSGGMLSGKSVANYGDVTLTLKKQTEDRTTFAGGDTLFEYDEEFRRNRAATHGEDASSRRFAPVSLTDPNSKRFGIDLFQNSALMKDSYKSLDDLPVQNNAVESHIHGGVTLDDIEKVTIHYAGEQKEFEKFDFDSIEAMRKRGIEVEIMIAPNSTSHYQPAGGGPTANFPVEWKEWAESSFPDITITGFKYHAPSVPPRYSASGRIIPRAARSEPYTLNESERGVLEEQIKASRMSWVRYDGPRGGKGWKNSETGEVTYQDDKPGDIRPPKPGEVDSSQFGKSEWSFNRNGQSIGSVSVTARPDGNAQISAISVEPTEDVFSHAVTFIHKAYDKVKELGKSLFFDIGGSDSGNTDMGALIERLQKTGTLRSNGSLMFADDKVRKWSKDKFDNPKHARNFTRFFGDSAVKNSDGTPLVVYHSTRGDFSEFTQTQDVGFHFGSPEQANYHAGQGEGVNIMPTYLYISNPLRLEDHDWDTPITLRSVLPSRGVKVGVTARKMVEEWNFAKGAYGYKLADIEHKKWKSIKDFRSAKNKLKREVELKKRRAYKALQFDITNAGYDGAVYGNEIEGEGDSYIAFEPTQIKSASANLGGYDPSDARFRMSWTAYDGPRGGTGWEDTESGEVAYQEKRPGRSQSSSNGHKVSSPPRKRGTPKFDGETVHVKVPKNIMGEIDHFRTGEIDEDDMLPWKAKGDHVTILQNIEPGTCCDKPGSADRMKELIGLSNNNMSMSLGKIKVLRYKDKDLLVVEVRSPELREAHGRLKKGVTDHFDHEYKPHVTLGLLKRGAGDKYAGRDDFLDRTFTSRDIEYGDVYGDIRKLAGSWEEYAAGPAWVSYTGSRGGTGWQDSSNPSDVRYQDDKPQDSELQQEDEQVDDNVREAKDTDVVFSDASPFADSSNSMSDINDLGGGMNVTYVGKLGDGTKVVYKPNSGESSDRMYRFAKSGTQSNRELAAYIVSEALGIGMVPRTAKILQGAMGEGSIQEWVNSGAQSASEMLATNVEMSALEARHRALVRKRHPTEADAAEARRIDDKMEAGAFYGINFHPGELTHMFMFDALIGNCDRHLGNWMVKGGDTRLPDIAVEQHSIHLIDNGLSFGENRNFYDPTVVSGGKRMPKLRTGEDSKIRALLSYSELSAGEPAWMTIQPAMDELFDRENAVTERLSKILEPEEVEAFWRRARALRLQLDLPVTGAEYREFAEEADKYADYNRDDHEEYMRERSSKKLAAKSSNVNNSEEAESAAASLALQSGITKIKNGVEYVLKNHRWHRVDREEKKDRPKKSESDDLPPSLGRGTHGGIDDVGIDARDVIIDALPFAYEDLSGVIKDEFKAGVLDAQNYRLGKAMMAIHHQWKDKVRSKYGIDPSPEDTLNYYMENIVNLVDRLIDRKNFDPETRALMKMVDIVRRIEHTIDKAAKDYESLPEEKKIGLSKDVIMSDGSPFDSGTIDDINNLGGGMNATYVGKLGDGTKVVYKPNSGESSDRIYRFAKRGTQSNRELAAYLVSEAMGIGLAPRTAKILQGAMGEGSIQEWINSDAEPAVSLINLWNADKTSVDKLAGSVDHEDLRNMLLYDILIGNADRHAHNWLIKDKRIVCIDNGLSFATNKDYYSVEYNKGFRSPQLRNAEIEQVKNLYKSRREVSGTEQDFSLVDKKMMSHVDRLFDSEEKFFLTEQLKKLISKEELDSFWNRARAIVRLHKRGKRLPIDSSDYSAFASDADKDPHLPSKFRGGDRTPSKHNRPIDTEITHEGS